MASHHQCVLQIATAEARASATSMLTEQLAQLETCGPEQVLDDIQKADSKIAVHNAAFERLAKQCKAMKAELQGLHQSRCTVKRRNVQFKKLVAGAFACLHALMLVRCLFRRAFLHDFAGCAWSSAVSMSVSASMRPVHVTTTQSSAAPEQRSIAVQGGTGRQGDAADTVTTDAVCLCASYWQLCTTM